MRNHTVVLGLGSNLGIPLSNLRAALAEIKRSSFFEVLNVSSIYESEALLPQNAPAGWNQNYLNAAVLCRFTTESEAEAVLKEIKRIETQLGRVSAETWAPRVIDLDILYWSQPDFKTESLQIPHARLSERPFALLPLLELMPEVQIRKPQWAEAWVQPKPFNTHRSHKYFWPEFVGVLNITPDSFSDGGNFLSEDKIAEQATYLLKTGADILELGAESTRPGAKPVSNKDELARLETALKVIRSLKNRAQVSLDCRNPEVLAQVLEKYELNYLNDVEGFVNPEMLKLLKASSLPAFVMHSIGVPPTANQTLDLNSNPCEQLAHWWKEKIQKLDGSKLIFDPGIGFGKTPEQSLYILTHLGELSDIKSPIMIGHSRKSFLKLLSDLPPEQRDLPTALMTQKLNLAYVQYLRVHNIEAQVSALRVKAL